jgi:catechol 2,3-dioxygenase-like lactoylglutathione lyase family enzyme
MITDLDHVVIAVRDIEAGVATYQTLLGRAANGIEQRDGVATALIATDNVAVELMAPIGEGDIASRLRATIEENGEGLKSLVFAARDIEAAHRRAARLGLDPEPVAHHETWRSFRAATQRTHGVRLFLIERASPLLPSAGAGLVIGLDHLVIQTPDVERAAALYGARLALDMRLEREVAGRRLMFFRCGAAILEIAHDPSISDGKDVLWGLSWRVRDADGVRGQLAAAGLDVSDVRIGVKPGTRVFTVRDGTCGVPTLMIQASPKSD